MGKNHWKSSYFSKSWDFGSFNMRAFVKIRDYITSCGEISKGYNLANIWRKKSMDTIFRGRNPWFFHLKLSVLHLETVLKFSKFNPITYGGGLIGLNFENFKTVSKCKTDSFKWKNQGFLLGKWCPLTLFAIYLPNYSLLKI